MKYLWLLLFVLLQPLSPSLAQSFGQFDVAQLNQLTLSPEKLSGQFSQQKYLADFDMQLASSGEFNYIKSQSVNWHTLAPIENKIVMTPQSITSEQGGTQIMQLQADSNPVVSVLSDIFFSVLTSQWQQLEVYFTFSGELDDGQWQVVLTPKDSAISQAISNIELQGDAYLRQLKFIEHNGDYTDIRFVNLRTKQ
ncbi:Outer-membrane lipoprotein carrier protein [Paraglaciecola mesophila]|uniref:Outer-membrane lipoprotein carrier protein n=1 Tax=Paraglaciecola mesophila TaxID=197222 RepID=A0A857JKK5_9ALTE|nr:outer membrane lipoprotein carrier protein LolA [Paraglaciecola mesophila]QHJ12086.1 Outer-membrane lipoprotein carrier protein [Paraglaciecola mesophila]